MGRKRHKYVLTFQLEVQLFRYYFFWIVFNLIMSISEMATPSKEELALQVELQRLQSARRLDEEEFDNQRQVLQAQLQNEVSERTVGNCLFFFIFIVFPVASLCPVLCTDRPHH